MLNYQRVSPYLCCCLHSRRFGFFCCWTRAPGEAKEWKKNQLSLHDGFAATWHLFWCPITLGQWICFGGITAVPPKEDSPKDWIHTGLMKSPEVLDVATNLQWTGLWFLTRRVAPVFIRLSTFERFISCICKQPMNMYKHKRTLKQTYPLKHPANRYWISMPIFQGVV